MDFSVAQLLGPERQAVAWMLVSFIGTGGLTRLATRRIRARQMTPSRRKLFRDIHIAGVHVHHQVWGMLIVLVVGLLHVTYEPHGRALVAVAIFLGVGTALALDEFAMWVHVEDVYWSAHGRKSISALLVAAAILLAMTLGADPLGWWAPSRPWLIASACLTVACSLGCALKGKLPFAVIGLFLPPVAAVGAVRLAKPGSWWARRWYAAGSRRDVRSRARFGPAYERRWAMIRDLIGGDHERVSALAPSTPNPSPVPGLLPARNLRPAPRCTQLVRGRRPVERQCHRGGLVSS
ncbi:hypothetical protein G9U51_11020 [Calidifontibacter sp. DB0510]|uniref:Integral membrane protein n=1 Tax=Metallococcus carri TaxID=1656884 RepID=A0A967B658_9MICO|nr:hypothetical protein [Metallococcus carri]NHN56307.1 hypothetical protein [Metallococcus carri]NOP38641.1 hypothetical protein [Calidifontibacter sp. DB2511S]